MAAVPYRLDAQQWLLADEVMQAEASKPLDSRHLVSVVVKHIGKNSFLNAAKTPTGNAIKKRYETYFLGPGQLDGSLVELADTRMDRAARIRPRPTSSELAVEIKNTYFARSPSALHTHDAIENRYITVFLKWDDADEMMRYAARTTYHAGKKFRIGAVVNHIKQTFFSSDPLTTETHIQDRYCKHFLGIDNTAAAVRAYDDRRVAQEWSVLRREGRASRPANHPNTGIEPAQSNPSKSSPTESPSRHQEIPRHSVAPLQGPASLTVAPPPPISPLFSERCPSAPSSLYSHKRVRGNSFDSNSSTSASYYTGRSVYTNFSHPQLHRFEMQLRDSGFFSSSSASDTTSLISRMSRLSIEVKLCEMDHTRMGPGNPCSICRYPEPRPKPLVYVAPEYAAPQRADVVDADDMDNGIMTRNANAKIS